MDLLQSRLGFGFSAGFFDYVLNYGKATHPLYLLPVGAAYSALYYFLFRWCIVRFDLRTPGREPASGQAPAEATATTGEAGAYVDALGGAGNIVSVDACTTRLRLVLANRDAADPEALKRLGARGSVRVGDSGLQVVVGPAADQLAADMRTAIRAEGGTDTLSAAALLAALGGPGNVRRVEPVPGRLLVTVASAARVDGEAVSRLGARGMAVASATSVHVLVGDPRSLANGMAPLIS
jgi:PTS system N-acetylglucosamine-specific IIC component